MLVSGINHFRECIQFSIQFMRLRCLLKKTTKVKYGLIRAYILKGQKNTSREFSLPASTETKLLFFFGLVVLSVIDFFP